MSMLRVCIIGFGEVGVTLADDLRSHEIRAWDIRFCTADSKPSMARRSRELRPSADAAEAVRGADLVISAVTAAQTVAAAQSAAPALGDEVLFVDLNSASPAAKRDAARVVNAAGGRYVEAAVMSPIAPKRIAAPILLGGPFAQAGRETLRDLGFTGASVFAADYGRAAAAKLCRSVMVKGLEALMTESVVAARHYGVEDTVLGSLDDLFPGADWPTLSRYMIARAIEHGVRRAEEMREAALTVEDAGVAPLMSEACAARQVWCAQFTDALDSDDLAAMLDAMRDRLPSSAVFGTP